VKINVVGFGPPKPQPPRETMAECQRKELVRLREELRMLRQTCGLVLAQFDGIGDDSWATMGMRVAIERLRERVER